MTTAQIALSVIMIIASLFLIVVVLLQEGAQQGLGAIEGGADTFFGKGKASASDRIFARLTSIVGVISVRRICRADCLTAAALRHDLRPQ